MSYSLSDRLSKLIFIELKDLTALNKINEGLYSDLKGKDILFPVDLSSVSDKNNVNALDLTMDKFFIGMLLCIGGNNKFVYNDYYENIILSFDSSQEFYKGYIYSLIQKDDLFDAYIMLKGLSKIYFNKEYKEKLIVVLFNLKDKSDFLKTELEIEIENSIKEYIDFHKGYLYKSMMYRDDGNYVAALSSLEMYIKKHKGSQDSEIENYKRQLLGYIDYEDGKEKIYSSPTEALRKLIPLVDVFKNDPLIYYYIAVAHRKLEMYEQAIYYLECSREIDTDIVEVVNEIGLSYAGLNMFEKAVSYFETVFKVTNAIEVCTNIVMCYLKLGKIEKMNEYFEKAKKINPSDGILEELEHLISKVR